MNIDDPYAGELPEKRDQFGQAVIDKIERYSPGFKELIVHMEVRTPHELEEEIGLTEGNIFQGELTIDQLLFNRQFALERSAAGHLREGEELQDSRLVGQSQHCTVSTAKIYRCTRQSLYRSRWAGIHGFS